MATDSIGLSDTEWTRITDPGRKGTCWRKTGGQIIVDHTDQEGADTLPITNTNVTVIKSKRVPLDEDSNNVLRLNPANIDDVFYARSLTGPNDVVNIEVFLDTISTFAEELYIDGKSFLYEDYLVFGADEVKIIVLDTSAFTGTSIVFSAPFFAATSGPILIDFHPDVTANADGTVLAASNRRYAFPGPASVLRLNPTGISLGAKVGGDMVPASGVGVGNTAGAANEPQLFVEIDPTKKFAYEITNTNGADTYVQIKLFWSEL